MVKQSVALTFFACFNKFQTEANRKFRLHVPPEKVSQSEYKKSRSVFHKVTLAKGRYCIIPSTEEPGQAVDFVMRVYTGGTTIK